MVGGLFHENGVVLIDENLGGQVDALLGSGDDVDVFHRAPDAVLGQVLGHGLPQGRPALALLIAEGVASVPVQDLVEEALKVVCREDLGRRGGAGEVDAVVGDVDLPGGLGGRGGADKGAAAHPGPDISPQFQLFIGGDHGDDVDLQAAGQGADGGEAGARGQDPGVYGLGEGGDDLGIEGWWESLWRCMGTLFKASDNFTFPL